MKTFLHSLLIPIVLTLFGFTAKSQSQFVSLGSSDQNSNGSISYSLGLLDFENITVNKGSLYAGVQHPYEIFDISSIEDKQIYELTIYPNPTSSQLSLNAKKHVFENARYELLNVEGKIIDHQELIGSKITIDLSQLKSGVYILKIIENKSDFKTYKIIKK